MQLSLLPHRGKCVIPLSSGRGDRGEGARGSAQRGHLRGNVLLMLLLLPVVCFADGFAAKGFTPTLRETDQSAVIRLEPGRATVDMYIGITGIPQGKTITYILPFWYKPEGFRMAEMEAGTYQQRYVQPASKQVGEMNRLASGATGDATIACIHTAALFTGPASLILFPVFAKAREKSRQGGVAGTSGTLLPYATATTPHARAELYEIGKEDLQTLIAQAGLPAKHAAPLKKYRTRFFAVMRLTGLGIDPKDREAMLRGVHYHFTHPLTGSEYTYPLGTGAAWPQPITATQVYVTCPTEYELAVDAPTEGMQIRSYELARWVRDYRMLEAPGLTAKEFADIRTSISDEQDYLIDSDNEYRRIKNTSPLPKLPRNAIYSATASVLHDDIRHTSAWHIAYFHSNPSEDIHVRMSRRSNGWLMAARQLLNIKGVPYVFAFGILLLSCAVASRLTLYRPWVAANKPCRFVWFCVQAFFRIFIAMSMVFGISIGIAIVLLSDGYAQTLGYGLLVLLLSFVFAVLWRILARNPMGQLLKNKLIAPWVLAFVLYIALSVGFIALVAWTGTAITG